MEKVRVAQRAAGEAVFNIFHNLLVGADAKLQSDLQLDIPVGDSTNAYINLDQHGDVRMGGGEKGEGEGRGRGRGEGKRWNDYTTRCEFHRMNAVGVTIYP